MKIITLHQPWASLIALGLKEYETRSWFTKYCGPLLIHAAKRPFIHPESGRTIDPVANQAWMQALDLGYQSGLLTDQSKPPFAHQLPLGAVVAVANLRACYEMREGTGPDVANYEPPHYVPGECFTHIDSRSDLERAVGDWRLGRYAWCLEEVQPLLCPIPWRGAQGLRNVPPELEALTTPAA